MKRQIIRQGDVLLVEINELPPNLAPNPNPVIAYGEGTGHRHHFPDEDAVERYTSDEDGDFLDALIVRHSTEMVHDGEEGNAQTMPEEFHKPVQVPAGTYQVIRQQEVDPVTVSWRTVAD